MHFYTYKITNLINGKIYVGVHKTANLEDGYMGSGKILKRSISKHGIENFKKDILMMHDSEEEMFEIESLIVDQDFIDRSDTYNIKLGGQGGWDHLNKDAQEMSKRARLAGNARQRKRLEIPGYNEKFISNMSLSAIKMWTNPGYRELVSNSIKDAFDKNGHPWSGRRHKLESIEKVKKTFTEIEHQKGEKNSQFGKMWIHSLEERKSTRINKNDPIPKGWIKGRKMFK